MAPVGRISDANASADAHRYRAPVIFHIAKRSDWDTAQAEGEYRVSTLGRTLDDEGFIHASSDREQTLWVANSFYANVDEPLVLLVVDETQAGDVRRESPPGSDGQFPHVYGPIPLAAVTTVAPFGRDNAGRFSWPSELG